LPQVQARLGADLDAHCLSEVWVTKV
jgi:hypothetical protein